MLLLLLIPLVIRTFHLNTPSSVVFDEVHFGGFTRKYFAGSFFVDVHPPLAKLLIALAAWISGYDGVFDFGDIGKDYGDVPYTQMRLVSAMFGFALVPITYFLLKQSRCSSSTSLLAAALVSLENSLVTQSRLVLLDAPLLTFTAITLFSYLKNADSVPFSRVWWFWMVLTGAGLGAACSVKWVGLFLVAWVGLLTLYQLWTLLGDLQTPISLLSRHIAARALCLILLPSLLYSSLFYLHFTLLPNSGDGNGFMSPQFQQTLVNKSQPPTFALVAYGSSVTIRHVNSQGGYLHSHPHNYPTGSLQQQVTLYPHKDDNNIWTVANITDDTDWNLVDPVYLQHGSVIRLEHKLTQKRLHSHDHKPPVSDADWKKEVSAYGFPGFPGDANDYFRIELVNDPKGQVKAISSQFRLIHQMSGCALFSNPVKLPEWGFEQQQVVCATSATLPNTLWYFETNHHPKFNETANQLASYTLPSFWQKFWELQKVMWNMNAGLTASHPYDSRPAAWPFLHRGINYWDKSNTRVYLFGNPLIWWSSSSAIIVYLLVKSFAILRWQRGYNNSNSTWRKYDWNLGIFTLGWALHYLPFFLMSRQLFLHHYLVALYFSILVFCQLWDFLTTKILKRRSIATVVTVCLVVAAAAVYLIFAPLIYATPWTPQQCEKAVWRSSWDFGCSHFRPLPSQTIYRDLQGNQISKEQLDEIVRANHGNVSLQTIYSTETV